MDKIKESKVEDYYSKILELIRRISRRLDDDDAFELHEKLKEFFNRTI
jgi:hypothetical protein